MAAVDPINEVLSISLGRTSVGGLTNRSSLPHDVERFFAPSPPRTGTGTNMELNLTWITPQLALGGCLPHASAERMARELRIGMVVDLRDEIRMDPVVWTKHDVEFLSLPTVDHFAMQPQLLEQGVICVLDALSRRLRVVVHCQHGIGRSALLVSCVLIAQGDGPCQALAMLKRARPIVSPSPTQLHALLAFGNCWCDRHDLPRWPAAWQDLADIAYAHVAADATGARPA
jgi:hypothetical protein